MSNKPQTRYKGDLAKPLPRRRRVGPLSLPEDTAQWNAELRRRFLLLLDHYHLKPDDPNLWTRLAVELIHDHVPGLEEAKPSKRGAPKTKATPERQQLRAYLLHEAERLLKRGFSRTRACELLKQDWERKQSDHPLAGKSIRFLRDELALAHKEHRKQYQRSLVRALRGSDLGGGGLFALGAERPVSLTIGPWLLKEPPNDTEEPSAED